MLSDKQRRTALKKNIARARDMARRLLADGVEEITLTYYADEGSFRAMRLSEEQGSLTLYIASCMERWES